MDIELRLLRSFVQIHEAGSISRAAERMACTQAAMSMRLKMLETELGAALFERKPQGLEPTPRGAEFYAKTLAVLGAYDEMMSATRSRPARDRIRLGMPDDYALSWLGRVLPEFPAVEFDITCDLSAQLMAQVQRAEIDLALVTLAARPSLALAVREVPLHWVRAQAAVMSVARLAAYPEGCVFRRAMIGALEAAAQSWQVVAQSRSHAGIFAPVRAGIAVTSVAAGTAPPDLVEFAESPGFPALPTVPVYLVAAPTLRRSARKFAERLVQSLDLTVLA